MLLLLKSCSVSNFKVTGYYFIFISFFLSFSPFPPPFPFSFLISLLLSYFTELPSCLSCTKYWVLGTDLFLIRHTTILLFLLSFTLFLTLHSSLHARLYSLHFVFPFSSPLLFF